MAQDDDDDDNIYLAFFFFFHYQILKNKNREEFIIRSRQSINNTFDIVYSVDHVICIYESLP